MDSLPYDLHSNNLQHHIHTPYTKRAKLYVHIFKLMRIYFALFFFFFATPFAIYHLLFTQPSNCERLLKIFDVLNLVSFGL